MEDRDGYLLLAWKEVWHMKKGSWWVTAYHA
jgi:hypothetical protein